MGEPTPADWEALRRRQEQLRTDRALDAERPREDDWRDGIGVADVAPSAYKETVGEHLPPMPRLSTSPITGEDRQCR